MPEQQRAESADPAAEPTTTDPDASDGPAAPETDGLLVLAGAPIGNLGDVSHRLTEELSRADVIAAEDTRRLRRLLDRVGIDPAGRRIVSYFDGNEEARTPRLLEDLTTGTARVVLVTDAGMPSISDPGFRLVQAAVAAGVAVTAVPGPSAVLVAVGLSDLPTDRFCFEGFLPRRPAERRKRLGELATEPRTQVFFEAPHRTADALADLAAVFGPGRRAAVCRELTKVHEEVRRGTLEDLHDWATAGIRGEVTLVVAGAAGADENAGDRQAAALADVAELTGGGMRLKPAVTFVAARHDLAKNALYEAALSARG